MTFKKWVENKEVDKEQIFLMATTEGISAYRGIKPKLIGQQYSSDPGDFGRGIYYSTNWYRARSYAPSDEEVRQSIVKFKNPIILKDTEAYKISEKFNTVVLSDEELVSIRGWQERKDKLLANSQAMTDYMISQGYDGLISIDKDENLEIVDYRPYFSKL